jgi:hypothetical protein
VRPAAPCPPARLPQPPSCRLRLTVGQVKVAGARRQDDAARVAVSAGGIEWRGDGFDAVKLPDIVGGGAVGQNVGADVFDFHEQQQQQQKQRDRHTPAPRAPPT